MLSDYLFKNEKCIFRGESSGVFFGTLIEHSGKEVLIANCRRIWHWEGANSITDLAIKGTGSPEGCKFTKAIDNIIITDCIEILPCTETAISSIESVAEWTY